jgi:hypothetical protein
MADNKTEESSPVVKQDTVIVVGYLLKTHQLNVILWSLFLQTTIFYRRMANVLGVT